MLILRENHQYLEILLHITIHIQNYGCYSSIVNQSNYNDLTAYNDSIYKYMQDKGGSLAKTYFTALGRERYSMYKTNNNPEKLKEQFKAE